jgi:hypothetical protein
MLFFDNPIVKKGIADSLDGNYSLRRCILGNWESKCSGIHLPKIWQFFVIGKIART